MWVGEDGVEAVVILAIDDMRGHERWEAYLRPILERLKKIDGRAPVSIMTCSIDPQHEHLQKWLKEGVSLECHTIDHPCPILRDGDFAKAKSTYDRCVDLMFSIPNNKPVAFRTPCCDSLNTNSPRLYAEIFNKTTPTPSPSPEAGEGKKPTPPSPRFGERGAGGRGVGGNFLHIDSSVFHVFTSNDPALPRELVQDADGREKFQKYLPRDRSFVNTIENYPYPYVIGRTCWQFPCMTPSDWQAQHLHKPNNPITVRDWQAALDCTVLKQGVFCMVFHPHGWITPEQVIQFIDHAQMKHGKKVKFLTFKEALERVNKNLLGGQALRDEKGRDNGVRLLDVNNDGWMDVVLASRAKRETRVWTPRGWTRSVNTGWVLGEKLSAVLGAGRAETFLHFGVTGPGSHAAVVGTSIRVNTRAGGGAEVKLTGWRFDGKQWVCDEHLPDAPQKASFPPVSAYEGVRLHDLDHDGIGELMLGAWPRTQNERGLPRQETWLLRWNAQDKSWKKLPFGLPADICLFDQQVGDLGLRFIDLNGDGHDDVVFSNEERYGIWLFESMEKGWSKCVVSRSRRDKPGGSSGGGSLLEIPPITIKGANNGFFVHSRHLWWQNEHTTLLKDHMDRRSFAELLKDVQPQPKSPQVSLQSIQCRPGFTVELVAAEPLVQDPIAFAFGPDGKLWVVEMGDYPLGVTPSPPTPLPQGGEGRKNGGAQTSGGVYPRRVAATPVGRVRFLEDVDGDGRYDKSTIFLDELAFPTGVLPWRKGVLVTCAPDIFYAEDTDGDGKADKRAVLFTGFKEGNPQHLVNGLQWGLDGWVYGANGDSGGVIRRVKPLSPPTLLSPKRGEGGGKDLPSSASGEGSGVGVNLSGRDFRFKPDTGEFELVTGMTQFGRCRDDWGNWFGGNNANPLWHFVLEDRYLKRNPHFAPPSPRVDVPVTPGQSPVYPISRLLPRFNDFHTANRFTSACSPTFYRDDLFGPHFANSVFICEPVHNLVSRQVVSPEGVTFRSRRAPGEEQSEFLASTDNWFRPVFAQTGPDGALWIADMYRHVIEHPEWIPKETQKQLDLRAGHDKGRIYRVYPVDKKPRPIPRLDQLSTEELVNALDSPNGWQRDMSMMLLAWRNDKAAAPLLEKLAAESKRPQARVQALCTLEVVGGDQWKHLATAFRDDHPGVRRNAVRLLIERSNKIAKGFDELPLGHEFDATLTRLAADPDPQVRMQLAYTLGSLDDKLAGRLLGQLAVKAVGDRYLLAAVLSSLNAKKIEPVLLAVLANGSRQDTNFGALLEQLLRMAGAFDNQQAVLALLNAVATPEQGKYALWQFAALGGFLDALEQKKSSLVLLERSAGPEMKAAIQKLAPVFEEAWPLAALAKTPDDLKIACIRLMGRGLKDQDQQLEDLAVRLAPHFSPEVQSAILEAFSRSAHPRIVPLLMQEWITKTPGLRSKILTILLRRQDWLAATLAEMERQRVSVSDVDASFRQQLLNHEKPDVRARAVKLFAGTIDKDRQKVLDAYQGALTLQGDPAKGQPIFAKTCASCHRLAGVGNEVGPDLAALKDKSPQALLDAILNPNRAVEARFVSYLAATQNGLTITGFLSGETSNSITLVGTDGKPQTILRSNLASIVSTAKSAMPEGLEKDITPEQMADLLTFLASALPQPKRKEFPGNQPEVVKPDNSGVLKLSAKNAEIYGTSLVFEPQFANLGWWTKEDDHAVWTIDVPKAGKYVVQLDYACADNAAGDTFVLTLGEQSLVGKVVGTGKWEEYRQEKIGELSIPAGQRRVVFRSEGPIRAALIDLRAIRLTRLP
jgi:putative membrane-bound dehydrogenase-like protein